MWNCHSWPPDVSSNVKLAKLGSSANFGVLVIKASLFYYLEDPSAKVWSSAKCSVLVFKVAMLYSWGFYWPKKVCLLTVVYWYWWHLCSITWEDRSARSSAKIIFNNNITYYTWQIWTLLVEICNCHVGGVLGVFQVCQGVSKGVTSDLTVQCWLTVY